MPERANMNEEIEIGDRVEATVSQGAGAVVAVRVPRDLLVRIQDYGVLRGMSVSAVIREATERLVAASPGAFYVTTRAHISGPCVISGSPSLGGSSRFVQNEGQLTRSA